MAQNKTPVQRRGERWDRLVPAALVIGILLVIADVVWTSTLAPLVQGAVLSEPAVIAGQQVTTKLFRYDFTTPSAGSAAAARSERPLPGAPEFAKLLRQRPALLPDGGIPKTAF